MYNTDFKVKYYDIEQELIFRLDNKTEIKNTDTNTNNNEEPDNTSLEEDSQDKGE